jgi:Carboxypeptidase regulatory-like domain
MKVGRRCATALASFSSVTILATVPLRAQDEIVPAADSRLLNGFAVKDAFHLTSPHDVQRRIHGSLMVSREALEIDSPNGSGGISKKQRHSTGAPLQAQQQAATKVPIGSEAGEAPFAQLARQGSSVQIQAAEESGSILGTVLAVDRAGIPGAQIKLTNIGMLQHYTLLSGGNGEFAFTGVPPGTYFVTVNAKGFEPYTSAEFTLSTRQVYEMPAIQLSIATQKQVVVVRPTEVIAQMQVKAQEKQRLLAVFPNFYTSYVWDAAPLNRKQKFSLSARGIFDPGSLLAVGVAAGIEQANNSFAGYGQGAAGYGKRFGAAFGDHVIGGFLGQAVFPSIFHQDPRYFYEGSGSVKSRLVHALSWSVIVRSDSGHSIPNYSHLLGNLTAGAVSNLYYPRANRGPGLVFTNFAIGVARRAGDGVFREFVAKHLTRNVAGNGKP